MMRYLYFLFWLFSFTSAAQLWQEPLDTLSHLDKLEKLKPEWRHIKSYTVTDYTDTDSITSYAYYGFDNEGNLTEEFMAMNPGQNVDTTRYYYENGICQEAVYNGAERKYRKRKHVYNDKNRLIALVTTEGNESWTTDLIYDSNRLVRIKYPNSSWFDFIYDSIGQLSRKKYVINGKTDKYFNYFQLKSNVTSYTSCNFIAPYGDTVIACDSTIGTFNENGKLIRTESYFYMDETPHFMQIQYDRNGEVSALIIEEATGNVTTKYIRNSEGLLTRVEHSYADGHVYLYSIFEYEFR